MEGIWQPTEEGQRLLRKLMLREKEKEDREEGELYPMTSERKEIQIDCRNTDCKYYRENGDCANVAPAISLNPNGKYVCWSKKEIKVTDK